MHELPIMQKAMVMLTYSSNSSTPQSPFEKLVEDLLSQGYQIKHQLNLDKGLTYILEKEYGS